MLSQTIKRYLDENRIDYSLISHAPAYTASQTAQSAHVPGRRLVKVVMVKIDGKLAMVSIPSNTQLDLEELRECSHAKDVELAHEYEFADQFPDCDAGAMPPFGGLYAMDVYMAKSLQNRKWLAFNAGNHSELLKIDSADFLKLVHPKSLPNC